MSNMEESMIEPNATSFTFMQQVDNALHTFVHDLQANQHDVSLEPIAHDVPTWNVTVGDQSARLTLYDIEQYRSTYAPETPGLNELQSPHEALHDWYRHTFH